MSHLCKEKSPDHLESIHRVQTNASINVPMDLFEKIYLNPQNVVKGDLRNTFANPTPIGLLGFLMAASPLACNLMGWRGSGGGGAAMVGVVYAFGGILMILGTILEWILGNTFTVVVFATFGSFSFGLAITLTPSANALGAYTANAKSAAEVAAGTAEYQASLAFFFIFMAVITTMFAVCALRTNIIFFYMFVLLVHAEALLAASYWASAQGNAVRGQNLQVAAGAVIFAIVVPGWYLLFSQLLLSVDFPLSLPIGDLSSRIQGASSKERKKQELAA